MKKEHKTNCYFKKIIENKIVEKWDTKDGYAFFKNKMSWDCHYCPSCGIQLEKYEKW